MPAEWILTQLERLAAVGESGLLDQQEMASITRDLMAEYAERVGRTFPQSPVPGALPFDD